MKTGILGGTFNPIHNAHLQVARAALRECRLDRVLFLPAASPPHKEVAEDVSFEQRLAMVEMAIAGHPEFAACSIEAEHPDAGYSVDTLPLLQQMYPADEFYFIIGLDSFRDITSWKDYRRLFEMVHIVVARRPGPGEEDPLRLLPVAIEDDFCYDEKSLKLRHKSGHLLIFLETPGSDISSTMIRERVAAGDDIGPYVPDPVAAYIERENLYRPA